MSSSVLGLDSATQGGDPEFRLDVGRVIGQSVRVWIATLPPFLLIGLIVLSPAWLSRVAIAATGSDFPSRVIDLAENLLTAVLTGCITWGVFETLRARRPGVGEALGVGLSRFGTVFLTSLMAGIAVVLGLLLLVVPGLMLLTRYWVAIPAAVIEQNGAGRALQRSGELTAGNRWRILALAILVGLLAIAAGMVVGIVVGVLAIALPAGDGPLDAMGPWTEVVASLILIPFVVLQAITPTIVYRELRLGREGVDLDELLRSFE